MNKRTEKRIAVGVVLALTVLLSVTQWFSAGHKLGSGRLIVWFFNVGDGNAVYIQSPSGKQVLFDGGPGDAVLDKLASVMPFWDRSLDAVIVGSSSPSDLSGLVEVVGRYHVHQLTEPQMASTTPTAEEFAARLNALAIPTVVATEPTSIDLGGGARLDIIDTHPAIIARLVYGDTSILLAGRADEAELNQVANGLPMTAVVNLGQTSSEAIGLTLLQAARPSVAVLSGTPSPLTIDRLQGSKTAEVLTSGGDVRLISDGGLPTLSTRPL